MKRFNTQLLSLFLLLQTFYAHSQNNKLVGEAEETMFAATQYMVEEVSTNGGYLWNYLPDFSRQWGEMEAYKTMIWLQHPGTISMGQLFLDAYEATGDEYYYEAAEKAARAIIWGQSQEGGWNYMIDFAGERSLKNWYKTIGKNGWRLEEFQHYQGNCTFDDDVTSDAAKFLLRIYLTKFDPAYKPALDKAIDFILESQYPLGGWPQRYPLKHGSPQEDYLEYTSYYTFNDDVTWENTHFLIMCYLTLGDGRFMDPINRGMNFYIISQDASGGWGQQLDMNLKAAEARTYELPALLPGTTFGNAMLLLEFYKLTGDKKFLNPVPHAIKWLEEMKLPEDETEDGRYTHPTFVEVGTNKPVYVHRKGSNVKYGYYYSDYNGDNMLRHYRGKTNLPMEMLKEEYDRLASLPVEEATKDSPFTIEPFIEEGTPQDFYNLNRTRREDKVTEDDVKEIIKSLDEKNRWLAKHMMTSNPYIGEGVKQELTDKYASTLVGDETDTSPYRDTTDQDYLSTYIYIRNMQTLINYIETNKK